MGVGLWFGFGFGFRSGSGSGSGEGEGSGLHADGGKAERVRDGEHGALAAEEVDDGGLRWLGLGLGLG